VLQQSSTKLKQQFMQPAHVWLHMTYRAERDFGGTDWTDREVLFTPVPQNDSTGRLLS
jgi:hypothetical protein